MRFILPVYTTLISTPLHWVVFRQLQNCVYAVVSPGPVPYNASTISQLVGTGLCVQNAHVMKLSLFQTKEDHVHEDSITYQVDFIPLPSASISPDALLFHSHPYV